jgi:hypothetical protein
VWPSSRPAVKGHLGSVVEQIVDDLFLGVDGRFAGARVDLDL